MPVPRDRLLTALVAAALLAGAVARFVVSTPLWLDEALSVNIASLPIGDITDALRHDGHPPLYYWLLHAWMAIFGESDEAVRALSGVCALLSLPLLAFAGRRVAGRSGAAWTLIVVALSPYTVRYATEARMYSLVMLLVAAGFVLVARALDGGRIADLAGVAAVTAALLWTHYWAMYLVAATALVLLVGWWRRWLDRPSSVRTLGALVVGGLLFLPWIPVLLDQAAHTGTPWAEPSRPSVIVDVTLADLGGGGFAEARLYGVIAVVLAVVGVLGRRAPGGSTVELSGRVNPLLRLPLGVIAVTVALGAGAGLATGGAYASRYAAVVVPVVLVIMAAGMSVLPGGWLRGGAAVAVVGLSLVSILHTWDAPRTQAGQLAEVIADRAGPRDLVVVCPDQLGPSLERALAQESSGLDVRPYPEGDPRFVDWRDYEDRNAAADPERFADALLAEAGDAGIWVAWHGTYRTFEGQCEALVQRLDAARTTTTIAPPGAAFEPATLMLFETGS